MGDIFAFAVNGFWKKKKKTKKKKTGATEFYFKVAWKLD